ncbi:DNA translocase FtsK, partial [Candidatus Uhrbacteria bacterium]|nr:DNA translocase FtsK [Candidatus Uhrbacteria bacterium]
MKRRRHRRSRYNDRPGLFAQLSSGVKRGLLFVGCLALAVLIILSAFGLAGDAGVYIDRAMALAFGWMRLVAALGLMVIALGIVMPNSERITPWTYVGIILFFLSANGLINLVALRNQAVSERVLMGAGGYIGLVFERLGTMTLGFWGTVAVLAAFLAASLLLLFHSTWKDMSALKERWQGEDEGLEDEEESESDEDATEESDEDEEGEAPKRKTWGGLMGRRAHHEEALTVPKRKTKRAALPLDLLESRSLTPDSGDITRNSEVIEKTFENFGISVGVEDVSVGPTITQYAIRPAEGIKLSRIVSLQNDLALALAAHPIRIEAPIPGKSLVGIEVPNKSIATVSLRSILESREFKKSDAVLTVALGMDVTGKAWIAGLEKAPHMLVAGATGSGKSVCLNSIIVSLLYQHGPDMLKLILVDPKRVELPVYAGIPHLLVPPITKAEEAINALKWTVREMERRLDVLSNFGARNIAAYNKKAEEQMPYIVVVIDELADLMATSARDVEALIVRIAQMARAVGIHLVLATQRPSVDIITGTIKANIPTRIAFAVASQTDSRTILDYSGAEKLLGRGDMLYVCAEMSKSRRLQGSYLSDKEIKNVVQALKQEEAPDYNYDVVESRNGKGGVFDVAREDEPLLEDALEILIASGKASTSLLQRRLKIGYSRAARIMDLLEEQGVIGAQEGAKPREVLIESMAELEALRSRDRDRNELVREPKDV